MWLLHKKVFFQLRLLQEPLSFKSQQKSLFQLQILQELLSLNSKSTIKVLKQCKKNIKTTSLTLKIALSVFNAIYKHVVCLKYNHNYATMLGTKIITITATITITMAKNA